MQSSLGGAAWAWGALADPPWLLPTCLHAGGRSSAAGPAWQGGCSFNQPSRRFPWKEKLQVATRNFPGFSLSLISPCKMEAFC